MATRSGSLASRTSQNGGVGSTLLDPDLKDTRTREFATFLERELFPNFGVHAGFVYRQIDQLSQSDNLNRPVSAYNVPIAVPIPNPNGTINSSNPLGSIQGRGTRDGPAW